MWKPRGHPRPRPCAVTSLLRPTVGVRPADTARSAGVWVPTRLGGSPGREDLVGVSRLGPAGVCAGDRGGPGRVEEPQGQSSRWAVLGGRRRLRGTGGAPLLPASPSPSPRLPLPEACGAPPRLAPQHNDWAHSWCVLAGQVLLLAVSLLNPAAPTLPTRTPSPGPHVAGSGGPGFRAGRQDPGAGPAPPTGRGGVD